MSGPRNFTMDSVREIAYYYGDLERLKRNKFQEEQIGVHHQQPNKDIRNEIPAPNPDELSEYVESNEVFNDGAINEVPPLRDRVLRQKSLPAYPERGPGETYSTAGTIPLPEQKEKEPLLAELEVVGRLPLTQLETSSVRRSRSWYLCCPNLEDEELTRESSWRYSSLRPVVAPPLPQQNAVNAAQNAVNVSQIDANVSQNAVGTVQNGVLFAETNAIQLHRQPAIWIMIMTLIGAGLIRTRHQS